MFHQQFLINQVPNDPKPEREIRKGRAWSQIETLDLFYEFYKNLGDVSTMEKDTAIRV